MHRLSMFWMVAFLGAFFLDGVDCRAKTALQAEAGPQTARGTVAAILRRSIQGGRLDPKPLIYSDDVVALADGLRIPEDFEPVVSSNRSGDPDVIAMKDIALAILEGHGRVDILTEAILLSIVSKGGNGVPEDVNELREAIRSKLGNDEFLRKVLEDDPNETPRTSFRGLLCGDCTSSRSWVCYYCYPEELCDHFWYCPRER